MEMPHTQCIQCAHIIHHERYLIKYQEQE